MAKTKCSLCGKSVEGKLLGRYCIRCDQIAFDAVIEKAEIA